MDHEVKHATVFDAEQQQLGDVYAKALLGFGQESGSLDSLIGELDAVVDCLTGVPKLRAALESPRVGTAEKESLLGKAFGDKVSKDLGNFLKILASKGRLDCLGAIRASAHKFHDEMVGRVQASVTTANEIDDSVRQSLEGKLAAVFGKKVALTAKVDPSIIGGMVVRVGDTVYDASVVNQLKRVRTKAVKRATDAIRESIDKFTAS